MYTAAICFLTSALKLSSAAHLVHFTILFLLQGRGYQPLFHGICWTTAGSMCRHTMCLHCSSCTWSIDSRIPLSRTCSAGPINYDTFLWQIVRMYAGAHCFVLGQSCKQRVYNRSHSDLADLICCGQLDTCHSTLLRSNSPYTVPGWPFQQHYRGHEDKRSKVICCQAPGTQLSHASLSLVSSAQMCL
jgi:hypothetical protein